MARKNAAAGSAVYEEATGAHRQMDARVAGAGRGLRQAGGGRFAVVPDAQTEIVGEQASNAGVVLFTAVIFAVVFGVCLLVAHAITDALPLTSVIVSVVVAALAAMSVHIAQQWEKVVVLRLGKFNRISGPGLFFTIPVIESCTMWVDTRVRVTTFGAEETLTSDLVPLNVDAVLFWMVYDAAAACTEVGDFTRAVEMSAQTALRDAIGGGEAAEVAIRRHQLDRQLTDALEEKTADWGVTILSVEIRDIVLPKELQDTMSLEAQAEQRKKARIILADAEQDIAAMMDQAGEAYEGNDAALRLRAMQLLYESIRETGGTVVVPSSFSEGFGDVLPDQVKRAVSKRADA